jgi:hypothetical protein
MGRFALRRGQTAVAVGVEVRPLGLVGRAQRRAGGVPLGLRQGPAAVGVPRREQRRAPGRAARGHVGGQRRRLLLAEVVALILVVEGREVAPMVRPSTRIDALLEGQRAGLDLDVVEAIGGRDAPGPTTTGTVAVAVGDAPVVGVIRGRVVGGGVVAGGGILGLEGLTERRERLGERGVAGDDADAGGQQDPGGLLLHRSSGARCARLSRRSFAVADHFHGSM